jgi:hypothetical protein
MCELGLLYQKANLRKQYMYAGIPIHLRIDTGNFVPPDRFNDQSTDTLAASDVAMHNPNKLKINAGAREETQIDIPT